jgi:hypothetical protein
MIEEADRAMYEAKKSGKNTIRVSGEMNIAGENEVLGFSEIEILNSIEKEIFGEPDE